MSSTKIFITSYNRSGLSSVTNSGVASRCGRPVGQDFGPNQWSDSPAPEMVENICSAVSVDQTLGVDDSNRVVDKRHRLWCRFKSLFSCNRKSVKNRVETNDSIGIIAEGEYKPSVSYRTDGQTDHLSDPRVLMPQISASDPSVVVANQTLTSGEETNGVPDKRHGFYCRLRRAFRLRFRSDVKNISEIEDKSESIHSEYLKPISNESTLFEDINQIETRVEANCGLNPAINGLESEMRSTADNKCAETERQISANNQHISVESNERHISIEDNDKQIPEISINEKPIDCECIPNQNRVRFESKPEFIYKKDSQNSSESSSQYFSCNQNEEFEPEFEEIPELDEQKTDPEDRRQELEAIPELEESPTDPEDGKGGDQEIDDKMKLELIETLLTEPKIPVQTKEIIKNSVTLL